METAGSLEAFFQDAIDRALKERNGGFEPDPHLEHYLVRLLADYATHPIDETPLALKMLGAVDAAPRERRETLREVGDTSLFVSGFWSESLAGGTIDVDYYIDLGGSAYGELARGTRGWSFDPLGAVYETLAAEFTRFVDVLAVVSQRLMPPTTPQDIVKLYERWRRTGSKWSARNLVALGVFPQRGATRPQ